MKGKTGSCRTTIPIVNMHDVLLEVGAILPSSAIVVGDPRSPEGASIDAERITVKDGIDLVKHGHEVLFKSKDDINGRFGCTCQEGEGSCEVLTTEDDSGNPGLGCISDDCSRCKLFTIVTEPKFNAAVIKALGVEISDDTPNSGDVTSETGCFVGASELRIQDRYLSSFVQVSDNLVALVRNNMIKGTFRCGCSEGDGGCGVTIGSQTLVCKPRQGCRGCSLVVNIPKLALEPI